MKTIARLILDFANEAKLAEWFENLRDNDETLKGVGVYEADGIDLAKASPTKTYLMAREGDRSETTRLVITETEEIERVI